MAGTTTTRKTRQELREAKACRNVTKADSIVSCVSLARKIHGAAKIVKAEGSSSGGDLELATDFLQSDNANLLKINKCCELASRSGGYV
jgi:hypothetical protein